MTDNSWSLSTVGALAVSPDVAYRIVQREAIVVDLVGNEVLVLNEVAARFLDLIAGGSSALEAVDVLDQEYAVDRRELEVDIHDLVGELLEVGILKRATA